MDDMLSENGMPSDIPGSYNRESGRKTLVLIGIIITLITVLSIASLLMINRRSSVLIQSTSTQSAVTPSR
jgi:hypothetical protein